VLERTLLDSRVLNLGEIHEGGGDAYHSPGDGMKECFVISEIQDTTLIYNALVPYRQEYLVNGRD